MHRTLKSNIVRGCSAAILLAGLAALVGRSLSPDLPLWNIVLHAFVVGSAASAVVLTATVASLQFGQFVIRKGGADAQWLAFPSVPAGLVALRDAANAEARGQGSGKAT